LFTRPPLFSTAGLVLGIAVSTYLFITPIEGPTWLPAFAPLSYGVAELKNTIGVVIPGPRPEDCETIGSQAAVWRAIASAPSGDRAFRRLFMTGNANGRLYALLGLTQLRARGLAAAISAARHDTAQTHMWRWNTLRDTHQPLSRVAVTDTLQSWAKLLMASPPLHACET